MPMKTLQAATSKKLTSIFQYPTALSSVMWHFMLPLFGQLIILYFKNLFDRLDMPVRVSKKIKKG